MEGRILLEKDIEIIESELVGRMDWEEREH